MNKKILITRLAGLGDVASILIPAVRAVHRREPEAVIDVLTYGAGVELMSLVTEVHNVLSITAEQWPRDIYPAVQSFLEIAKVTASQGYDRVICLDTWFMPCFLARVLKDVGVQVEGNFIDLPVNQFLGKLEDGKLSPDYFQHTNFMASTYPNMPDWQTAWWHKYTQFPHYPAFYLQHCCGFDGDVDMRMDVAPDRDFLTASAGRKIAALSLAGSKLSKRYPHAEELAHRLKAKGYTVWSNFDGRLPMRTTLGRLALTDLLITVATSTQWLAKSVGCPSLMIPGAMDPRTLGAELTVPPHLDCQYCCQTYCPADINFRCIDAEVNQVERMAHNYLALNETPGQ